MRLKYMRDQLAQVVKNNNLTKKSEKIIADLITMIRYDEKKIKKQQLQSLTKSLEK